MNKLEKKGNGKHSVDCNEKMEQQKKDKKSSSNLKSSKKTVKTIIISIISILVISCIAVILFNIFRPKIKNTVQIELGTQEIKIQDFLTEEKDAGMYGIGFNASDVIYNKF